MRYLAGMFIVAVVGLAPIAASAQLSWQSARGVVASPEWQRSMATLAAFARGLQQPRNAIDQLGDPDHIEGAASPILQFDLSRRLPPAGPREIWLVLWYGPPATAPSRLEAFEIGWRPPLTEKQIREWLGAPQETPKDPYYGRMLNYARGDKADLGVSRVIWSGEASHRQTKVRFYGGPR